MDQSQTILKFCVVSVRGATGKILWHFVRLFLIIQ